MGILSEVLHTFDIDVDLRTLYDRFKDAIGILKRKNGKEIIRKRFVSSLYELEISGFIAQK